MVNSVQGYKCVKCGNDYGDLNDNRTIGFCPTCSPKAEITIDFMMIVGKYFESSNDFINAMKVCKKYKELVLMYHFNPISLNENTIEFFRNIETLHVYNSNNVLDIKAYRNRLTNELNRLRRMVAERDNLLQKIAKIEKAMSGFSEEDVLYKNLANAKEQLEQGLNNIRPPAKVRN